MAIDICEQFGSNLRRIRRQKGFTQEELAHRVGMDVSYLSELENGKKEPCLRKMTEIAQALGTPVTRLLRGI
jgi:transcriptional regulator with XRE-family HTH domain